MKSTEEIAKSLGLNRRQVLQIEATALKKLRHPKMKKLIDNVMDNLADDLIPTNLEAFGDEITTYVIEGQEVIGKSFKI